MTSTFVINESERRGRVGICVSAGVSVSLDAVRAPQGKLILAAELGHGLGQHSDLISVTLSYEVAVPLFPSLGLEFFCGLFLNNLSDLDGLLGH